MKLGKHAFGSATQADEGGVCEGLLFQLPACFRKIGKRLTATPQLTNMTQSFFHHTVLSCYGVFLFYTSCLKQAAKHLLFCMEYRYISGVLAEGEACGKSSFLQSWSFGTLHFPIPGLVSSVSMGVTLSGTHHQPVRLTGWRNCNDELWSVRRI